MHNAMAGKSWTVVYRKGGRDNFTWERCLPLFQETQAHRQRLEIEAMGYKALVFDTRQLDAVGMPEGYEP